MESRIKMMVLGIVVGGMCLRGAQAADCEKAHALLDRAIAEGNSQVPEMLEMFELACPDWGAQPAEDRHTPHCQALWRNRKMGRYRMDGCSTEFNERLRLGLTAANDQSAARKQAQAQAQAVQQVKDACRRMKAAIFKLELDTSIEDTRMQAQIELLKANYTLTCGEEYR